MAVTLITGGSFLLVSVPPGCMRIFSIIRKITKIQWSAIKCIRQKLWHCLPSYEHACLKTGWKEEYYVYL